MTAKERVREEAARNLHKQHKKLYSDVCDFLDCKWEQLSSEVQKAFREMADENLSIEGIEIKSDIQSLPDTLAYHLSLVKVYQEDIERANFVKVEKK